MSKWFKKYSYTNNPKLRVFCFPYAGGNASVFSNWPKKISKDIDLFALQSPGRGARFSEKPIGCLRAQVDILHREILPYAKTPYMFIGHSNGALTAYELARELQKSGNCNLQHLIISAKRAPSLAAIKSDIHQLPHDVFIKKLKEYDFTPDEILQNQELMELFSPMLRADFSLSETYQFDGKRKLSTNASLFWGNKDNDVPLTDILSWQDLIEGKTDLIEFNGGHFFINKQEDKFLQAVNEIISQIVAKENFAYSS